MSGTVGRCVIAVAGIVFAANWRIADGQLHGQPVVVAGPLKRRAPLCRQTGVIFGFFYLFAVAILVWALAR